MGCVASKPPPPEETTLSGPARSQPQLSKHGSHLGEIQGQPRTPASLKPSASNVSAMQSQSRLKPDGTYAVKLPPKVPLGFLRRHIDQAVITHTVEAYDVVIANVRIGDKLVRINGQPIPHDPDFVNIMLISMREGVRPYKLEFMREKKVDKSLPNLVNPPDIYDDTVEWFSYWDYDMSGSINMDDMIHAVSFSLRLRDEQIINLRRGFEILWSKWDKAGLGIDILTYIEPTGLAAFLLCPELFQLTEGKISAEGEQEQDPDAEPDDESFSETEVFEMFDRFAERINAESGRVPEVPATMESHDAAKPRISEPNVIVQKQKEEKERAEKAHQQLVKNLENAIKTRNVELMEKQLAHWTANPDGAPTELLGKAKAIIAEDAQSRKEARWKEAEEILNFASGDLRGRAGLARLEKALEQTSHVPDFDNSKWRKMHEEANARIGRILDACDASCKQAKEFVKNKSEDVDAMMECKTKLEVALRAANNYGLGEDVKENDLARKKLHNLIQDVRGGTRVFCRVRPLAEHEANEVCIKKSALDIQIMDEEHHKDETFQFDAVFDAKNVQADIFVDCEDLVVSAIDGYNITIFAYGQTGAGKTHTMYGTKKMPGVCPSTISAVFKQITDSPHLDVEVSGTMVELYNNKVVDLLSKKADSDKDKEGHKVRYDSKNNSVFLEPPAESRVCASVADMTQLLQDGSEHRRVAFTQMNADSSRSHLFLILSIKSTNKDTGKVVIGKITLIDLAGSERLKKSEVSGAQQQEAIEINKSLTALGDVISALTAGKKRTEVPYRNHKLTQMLQDALGGSSKTIMFVCARPDDANVEETLMSLKYAQRARNIINTKQKKP
eukprot:GEMP01003922.1.p1 GENE.GEMP01003922.1~~GEMP01003922.1.p1  ORF type:complete len:843 (+),score=173.98 GEMP01003922.1:157-2685(+)